MLVDIVLEGCKVSALADSGSLVNTMMLEFIQEWGYLVLPLDKIVNYPMHLVGLGGWHTCPLGFVITRLQVKEVTGYDENVVFLVSFGKRVPLVTGICTLAWVIHVIKETELDQISTPWATVHLAQLLSWHVMTDESPRDEASGGQDAPKTDEMDEIMEIKDNVHVGPFQTEILKERVARVPAHDMHLMVAPIRCADVESGKVCPLPQDYKYYMLTPCSQLVVSMSQ